MSKSYKALAHKLQSAIEMNLSDNVTESICALICKDYVFSDADVQKYNKKINYLETAILGWQKQGARDRKTIKNYTTDYQKAQTAISKLRSRNKDLMEMLDIATQPGEMVFKSLGELEKHYEEKAEKKVPPVEKLADDEIPRLNIRALGERPVGGALRKQEVWQLRRYIESGRSPDWIEKKMGIGHSTISAVKHNRAYTAVPLEQRPRPKEEKPVSVHVGYGVETQKKKENTGKQRQMFGP